MFAVGNVRIHAVPELLLAEPLALFPAAEEAARRSTAARLGPDYFDTARDCFMSAIRSWVIQLPSQTVVVDTGAGNGESRPASPRFNRLDTPFLDRLAVLGVQPAMLDLVICTHLHVDHVGWNTRWVSGRWQPVFPNALYVLPAVEVEYWETGPGSSKLQAQRRQPFEDSVAPLLGRSGTLLAGGTELLAPGLRLTPLPGHSPGMMGVKLEQQGEQAMFIADALHSPVQVWHPELSSRYCADPEKAAATRKTLLEEAAATKQILFAAHVGGSGGMLIERCGERFTFRPVG